MDTSPSTGRGPRDNGHGLCSLSFLANTSLTSVNRRNTKNIDYQRKLQKLFDEKYQVNINEYYFPKLLF